MSFPVWINKPSGGSSPQVFNVMYLYSTSAGDPMRLTDTGTNGCSIMAGKINSHTDPYGNTYSITEQDADTVDFTTDLVGVDVLMTGSCNRIFNTTQRDALMAALAAGMGIYADSDNGINGGGNQSADSRDSMGFDEILGIQYGRDGFDGVHSYTLPANSLLGDALVFEDEGTSPFRVKSPYDVSASISVLNNHHTQSPGGATPTGVTYTGVWAAAAVVTYGLGTAVFMEDRQPRVNANTGSNITEFDNEQVVLNAVALAATGLTQS